MARILILRAASVAVRTLETLRADGHEPLLVPVDEIVPLEPACPDPAIFDAAIVTSVNAVPYAARHLPRAMSMAAVGTASGEALRSAGFCNVAIGGGEADAGLLDRCGREARVLYLAGRVRTDALERAAASGGRQLTVLEVYDTRPLCPSRSQIAAALGDRPADAVLVLSQGQAAGLSRLQAQAPELIEPTSLVLCISERIRAALGEPFRASAQVAPLGELKHRLDRL